MVSAIAVGLAVLPGLSQAAVSHAKKTPVFYVSLGDSYSVGFQPTAVSPTDPTGGTPGYTAYVAHHENMTLRISAVVAQLPRRSLAESGVAILRRPMPSCIPPPLKSRQRWSSSPPTPVRWDSSPSPSVATT